MNILCSCDDNYTPYCGIMLTSLFENNKGEDIAVYITVSGLSDSNKKKFSELASRYGVRINLVEVDEKEFAKFPVWKGDHVSIAAYYRLFSAELLPKDVDKVIYLDCDIIVAKSLKEMWDTDLEGKSMAAVIDCSYTLEPRNTNIGMKAEHRYINSGSIVMNLKYWRENNMTGKFIDFINEKKELLRTHDQDVLNGVLQDTTVYLPVIYNFQTLFLFKDFQSKLDKDFVDSVMQTKEKDIAVFHYCTPVKPWNCWHYAYPFDKTFHKYKNISLWKNLESKQTLTERAKCKVFDTLGIKKLDNILSLNK